MAILKTRGHWTKGAEIAANGLDIKKDTLISITGGYATKAVATGKVIGISRQTKVFDADNETVAQEKLTYNGLNENAEFDEIVSSNITQADVQKDYNLTANGIVDGITGGTWTQVRLIKVISPRKGRFIAL